MPLEIFDRIEADPVIRGTRIPVALILNKLSAGLVAEAIIADYPQLTQDDIRAALAFAAERCR